jgi:PiT family inorganic phosphate transporter
VSFAHGSNDGQKGMGLMMLILIGVIPASFALNEGATTKDMADLMQASRRVEMVLEQRFEARPMAKEEAVVELSNYLKPNASASSNTTAAILVMNRDVTAQMSKYSRLSEVPRPERTKLRTDLYLLDEALGKLVKQDKLTVKEEKEAISAYRKELTNSTRFIPLWVKVMVALALGIGTMVGWKRIVVTVGEKIGKDHLTYAQGASAEMVAMLTIGVADHYGLQVSTTHVLTSGVAGTMAANRSGVQMNTVRNMLLAWVLTLPACVFLGAALFGAGLYFISRLGL